jgi:hypothetical protein
MNDHIGKPIDPDELFSVLLRWTGGTTLESHLGSRYAALTIAGVVTKMGPKVSFGTNCIAPPPRDKSLPLAMASTEESAFRRNGAGADIFGKPKTPNLQHFPC